MPVKKTPRAIIEVLDAEGKVSGYEIENFYTFELGQGDDPVLVKTFTPKVVRDEATEEEVDAILGVASEKLTDAHSKLNLQVADLREDHKTEVTSLNLIITDLRTELRAAETLRDAALAKLAQVKDFLK